MKKNISLEDRKIRFILGAIFLALGVYLQSWWGILGLPLILTAIINTCPIYMMLGISTRHENGATCSVDPVLPSKEEVTPESDDTVQK